MTNKTIEGEKEREDKVELGRRVGSRTSGKVERSRDRDRVKSIPD